MITDSFTGVTQNATYKSKPWRAQIYAHGKPHYLKSFAEQCDAAKAYDNAAFYLNREVKGESHPLNFPQDYEDRDDLPSMENQTKKAVDWCLYRFNPPKEVVPAKLLRELSSLNRRQDEIIAQLRKFDRDAENGGQHEQPVTDNTPE